MNKTEAKHTPVWHGHKLGSRYLDQTEPLDGVLRQLQWESDQANIRAGSFTVPALLAENARLKAQVEK